MPKQQVPAVSIKTRLSQIRWNLWKRHHAKQQLPEPNHEQKESFRMRVAHSLKKASHLLRLPRPRLRLGWFNPKGTERFLFPNVTGLCINIFPQLYGLESGVSQLRL